MELTTATLVTVALAETGQWYSGEHHRITRSGLIVLAMQAVVTNQTLLEAGSGQGSIKQL